MNKSKVKKSKLENGLTVITYEKEGNIFSLGFGVKIGSLYEDEKLSGASHMLEHMLFKGTKNRDIDKFNDDVEELATEMDIYTSYDQTILSIDVVKNKAEKSIEIVSDMIMNPLLDEKEFNLEKKVIMEEIKMGEDDPEDIAYLGLYKEAFPDRCYKYHITGTMKTVKGITLKNIKEHHKKYYTPNNSIMCVCSSYTHEEIVNMANKYLSSWNAGDDFILTEKTVNIPSKIVKDTKKGISQAHLIYSFDIQHISRKENIILTLLSEKIGSGGNSILFKELRDKRGLAYSIYSDSDYIKNLKMFYIYAGVSEENIEESLETIEEIIANIKEKFTLDNKSLSLLKERFYIDTEVTLQSSSNIVDYMMQGEIEYENPLEYLEVLKIMEESTVDDLKEIANKILNNPLIYILMPK